MLPNPVSYCRAGAVQSASGSAPTPQKGVGSGLRSQIGPLARRGIPGCLRSALEHERASTPPTQSESPTCMPAGVVGGVSERTRENTQYNDDAVIGLVTQHVVQLHGPDVHPPCRAVTAYGVR